MLKIEKVAMNGLEGVELLEEVSLEMEKQSKLGNEKEVDRLGAMADKLGHALKEANVYKVFRAYKDAYGPSGRLASKNFYLPYVRSTKDYDGSSDDGDA